MMQTGDEGSAVDKKVAATKGLVDNKGAELNDGGMMPKRRMELEVLDDAENL